MTNVVLIDQNHLFQEAFTKVVSHISDCTLAGIAQTQEEALELIKTFRPQMVFLDVVIGSQKAIELCQYLKEQYPSTKVYILSGYCNINLIRNAMIAGVDEYLLKPISSKRLTGILEENKIKITQKDEQAQELFIAVEQREYMSAYGKAEKYIASLFEEQDRQMREERLKKIASDLFYYIPGMDPAQKKYYLGKYELNKKICGNYVLAYCWLIQIITEVFKQLCVMKYNHMGKVFQHIENNKNNEITLPELANEAEISSGYLSRIFKKYYHISVVDYIHLRKIHMAKQYMASSEMNISDISFLLGYSEAGYFCKIFKKYEKITPSAFHNQYIKAS